MMLRMMAKPSSEDVGAGARATPDIARLAVMPRAYGPSVTFASPREPARAIPTLFLRLNVEPKLFVRAQIFGRVRQSTVVFWQVVVQQEPWQFALIVDVERRRKSLGVLQ